MMCNSNSFYSKGFYAVCLASFLLLMNLPGQCQQDSAEVINVSGDVKAQGLDETVWNPVKAGQNLYEGTKLASGEGSSAVIEFKQGHRAQLSEQTTIALSELAPPAGGRREKITIDLELGRLLNRVKKLKTKDSEVV